MDIAKGELQNVGQCFAKIEPGAYFPGDAYAIYGKPILVFGILTFYENFVFDFSCLVFHNNIKSKILKMFCLFEFSIKILYIYIQKHILSCSIKM